MSNVASLDKDVRKLQRIPSAHKISKRPILHSAIPSPYTGRNSPKVVYITPKTPFMSAVQRTQKLLNLISKRERSLRIPTDEEILAAGRGGNPKAAAFHASRRRHAEAGGSSSKPEDVYLKGSGKAIHHLLQIALWFQHQPEYRIRITTNSEGVIDDIVKQVDLDDGRGKKRVSGGTGDEDTAMEIDDLEVPDTRIRMLSAITVAVGWR